MHSLFKRPFKPLNTLPLRAFSSGIDPTKNYYRILKLNERATEEDVKKNFRRLALFYHPDRNRGFHTEKFKLVNEAY